MPKRATLQGFLKLQTLEAALSASPGMKQLTLLMGPDGQKVEIIASVAGMWKDIGILLDFDNTGQFLNTIETCHENKPISCCQVIFLHWLKGNGVERTWGTLIDILKDCKLGRLAESVEKILMALEEKGICGKYISCSHLILDLGRG